MSDTSFAAVAHKTKLIDVVDKAWEEDFLSDAGKDMASGYVLYRIVATSNTFFSLVLLLCI